MSSAPIDTPTAKRSRRGSAPHPRRVASPSPAVIGALHAHHQQAGLLIKGVDQLQRAIPAGSTATLLSHLAERLEASDRRLHELVGDLEKCPRSSTLTVR
jgi:hypothetical protein